jgi:hypothetical protein
LHSFLRRDTHHSRQDEKLDRSTANHQSSQCNIIESEWALSLSFGDDSSESSEKPAKENFLKLPQQSMERRPSCYAADSKGLIRFKTQDTKISTNAQTNQTSEEKKRKRQLTEDDEKNKQLSKLLIECDLVLFQQKLIRRMQSDSVYISKKLSQHKPGIKGFFENLMDKMGCFKKKSTR